MELTEKDLVVIGKVLREPTLRQTIKVMADTLKKLGYVNLDDGNHAVKNQEAFLGMLRALTIER